MSEKERELEKLQVMLEEKGLFVGDLGEQRRHMQDVVGRIGSDMRLLEEKGRNMVARLSEMRGTLSGSEHQRRRLVEELDDLRARLDDARAAAEVARADVEKAEPASDDLHARRVDLDEQLRALTRDMREKRSVADSCALDYVKVKEALSNAELEDSMYASRLEQIDAQAEEVAASLESRRDRADEVDELLADARAQRDDMQEAIKAARAAQDARCAQEGEARGRLSDVRSELSSLKRLDERAADASPLAAQIARGRAGDVLARLGDVIEAPSELEALVEHLLGADIDALLVAGDEELARLGAYAQGLDATGQALLLSCSAERSSEVPAAGYRLVERLRVRDGYAQAVAALLGGVYVVDSVDEAVAAPSFPGVVYVTPDGARVAGSTVRIGSLGDAADGALERKRRIRATSQAARSLEVLRLRVDPLHDRYQALSERAMDWAARLRDQASIEEADSASLKRTIEDARGQVESARQDVERAAAAVNEAKVERGKLEVQVENAVSAITADGTTVLEEALALPAPSDRTACERELSELVRKINNLGPVNQVAFEEYERLRERADYISAQLADLEGARAALTKITAAIDRKMRASFISTFQKVDANFREVFEMLFPGGSAHLEMTDPDHPADTGIEVVAQPRGKRITKMMLMSGGEKSLTALALLFAVYRTRTVPFYVLDEVEAALDDSNLSKLIGAIDVLRRSTQLLVISHQRRTMEDADVLYGVSMQADGVSRVVSQRLDRETGKVVNA